MHWNELISRSDRKGIRRVVYWWGAFQRSWHRGQWRGGPNRRIDDSKAKLSGGTGAQRAQNKVINNINVLEALIALIFADAQGRHSIHALRRYVNDPLRCIWPPLPVFVFHCSDARLVLVIRWAAQTSISSGFKEPRPAINFALGPAQDYRSDKTYDCI